MAGKATGDRRKPRVGKGAKRFPRTRNQDRRHRLQGCRNPPQVHFGAREESVRVESRASQSKSSVLLLAR